MANELIQNAELILFENNQIRTQIYTGEWFYSIVDIVGILTESNRPEKYWNDLKKKIEVERNYQLSEKIGRLKMIAKDGKMRTTDCANRETIFRIIQSIPSPNAEPFKLWFARLAEERIQEVIDPSLAIERARQTYLKKGYTEEWKKRGINDSRSFSILTDEISKGTFGITTKQHKKVKSLEKSQNLRDNMSPMELALTTLAEVTTTELHKNNDSQGMTALKIDAHDGGEVASIARKNIEQRLGRPVITEENAIDFKNKKEIDYNK